MNYLIDVDWGRLFIPQMSLAEMLIRGTVMYVSICLMLRIVLKRQAGKVGLADLLVVTIIAGISRNPMVRDAYSITDGVGTIAVVLGWSYLLDWLSFHSAFAHRLLHPEPVVLIDRGEVKKENLDRELMTLGQLQAQLRQHGIKDPAQVAQAILEGSGRLSVIRREHESAGEGRAEP